MEEQELQPLNHQNHGPPSQIQQQQQQHHHHNNHQNQQQHPHPQQPIIVTPTRYDDSAQAAVELLLSPATKPEDFRELLPIFSSPLKNQFENRSLWLRLGLTYSLSKESPSSALQAFSECMRLDEEDPMPAILAAKLMLEDFDDPDNGLNLAEEAIKRCQKRVEILKQSSDDTSSTRNKKLFQNNLLSRSYLLASIMHAFIYEREPESIKQFKREHLDSSLDFLDRAIETNRNDYLGYFHKALHLAKEQKAYQDAIDNLRKAIQLNPEHVPSMQLLILSLSALKHYDKALVLCESTYHEHENNLLLLYIKCNLEQRLVETKGYKSALQTAQLMLKCIRRETLSARSSVKRESSTKLSIGSQSTQVLSSVTSQNNQQSQSNQHSQQQSTYPNQMSQHHTMTNMLSANSAGHSTAPPAPNITPNHLTALPVAASLAIPPKQTNNLFADNIDDGKPQQQREYLTGELSVWLLVAEIFVKVGSIEDAERCVDEASIHASGALSHQVMFVRGLIAKARNNLIEAKTFFQSSLALCPKHAKALQQIAHVYYLLGNYTTAEKFLKDSLDVDGDCYKTWHYLSLAYIEQNQHDRAKDCVKKATQLEESSPVVPISVISRLTFN